MDAGCAGPRLGAGGARPVRRLKLDTNLHQAAPRPRRSTRSVVGLLAILTGLAMAGSARATVVSVTRVSVATDGTQGNGSGIHNDVSDDGTLVVFDSLANNLVPLDRNNSADIFLHNRTTSVTERINLTAAGGEFESGGREPSISGDGQVVGFTTPTFNIPGGNGFTQACVVDRQTGIPEIVSINNEGESSIGYCEDVSLSRDGRYVAFASTAANLVPDDTNGAADIFVRDRQAGTTRRVSVSSTGEQGVGPMFVGDTECTISADGRFVGFTSNSTNLVAGDNNNSQDTFFHDLQTSVTELVSVTGTGVAGNNHSHHLGLSSDGRYVVYFSLASNLVPNDTNGVDDVFVRDRQLNTTEIVSRSSNGQLGNGQSFLGDISGDGRFVVFSSWANNLVTGDTAFIDVFVHDRSTRVTERVNVTPSGGQSNNHIQTFEISMDDDGSSIGFISYATNLDPPDSNNNVEDVYVADVVPGGSQNRAPVASAGPDQLLEIPHDGDPATATRDVTLDGRGSTDPDGNALTYQWRTAGGSVLGTTALLPVNLAAGGHSLTLNVTDPGGLFSEDTVLITVEGEPNTAPVANAGSDQTLTTDTPPLKVQLDGTATTDPDGDSMALRWKSGTGQTALGRRPTVSLAHGRHDFTLFATDSYGATRTDTVTIQVNPGLPVGSFPIEAMAVSSTAIEVRFKDPSRNERRFEIERSDNAGKTWRKLGTLGASSGIGKNLKYLDKTARPPQESSGTEQLQPEIIPTGYYYRVRAVLLVGEPMFSGVRICFTLATPTNMEQGDLTLITVGSHPLAWRNFAFGEEGVELEKSEEVGSGQNSQLNVSLLPRIPGADLQRTLASPLAPGQYHQFRVRTYNSCGTSSWSPSVAFFTPPDLNAIQLSGRILLDTPSLFFGAVSRGGELTLPVRLANQGPGELSYWKNLPTPFVRGSGDAGTDVGFWLARGRTSTAGAVLQTNAQSDFDVRFRAGSNAPLGPVNGSVAIYTSDPTKRIVIINLHGTVVR